MLAPDCYFCIWTFLKRQKFDQIKPEDKDTLPSMGAFAKINFLAGERP